MLAINNSSYTYSFQPSGSTHLILYQVLILSIFWPVLNTQIDLGSSGESRKVNYQSGKQF